jgi:hypothetical protein
MLLALTGNGATRKGLAPAPLKWRYVTQHNDTQHNDIQHNSKYNTTLTIMALSTMAEHC